MSCHNPKHATPASHHESGPMSNRALCQKVEVFTSLFLVYICTFYSHAFLSLSLSLSISYNVKSHHFLRSSHAPPLVSTINIFDQLRAITSLLPNLLLPCVTVDCDCHYRTNITLAIGPRQPRVDGVCLFPLIRKPPCAEQARKISNTTGKKTRFNPIQSRTIGIQHFACQSEAFCIATEPTEFKPTVTRSERVIARMFCFFFCFLFLQKNLSRGKFFIEPSAPGCDSLKLNESTCERA